MTHVADVDHELFPGVSSKLGIYHCGEVHEWRNLRWHVEADRWIWSCPSCGQELRADEYRPVEE